MTKKTLILQVANLLTADHNTFSTNEILEEVRIRAERANMTPPELGYIYTILREGNYKFNRSKKCWYYNYNQLRKAPIAKKYEKDLENLSLKERNAKLEGANNRLREKIDYLRRELDNERTANSSVVERFNSLEKTHTDLITEYEKIKHIQIHTEDELTNLAAWIRQFKNKLDSYDSVLNYIHSRIQSILVYKSDGTAKDSNPDLEKATKVQNLVDEVINSLLNDDYCSKCKTKLLCKSYNTCEHLIYKILGRFNLCPAKDILVQDFVDLHQLLNRGEYENL